MGFSPLGNLWEDTVWRKVLEQGGGRAVGSRRGGTLTTSKAIQQESVSQGAQAFSWASPRPRLLPLRQNPRGHGHPGAGPGGRKGA